MYKKIILCLSLISIIFQLSQDAFGQRKKRPTKPPTVSVETYVEIPTDNLSPDKKNRVEAFRLVWKTIYENYFDPTFNGLNWLKIRQEYEPKVVKLNSDYELHLLLQDLISQLNRSHFAIIPPEVIRLMEKAKAEVKAEETSTDDGEDDEEDGENDELNSESEDDYEAHYGIGIEMRVLNDQFVITRVEKGSAAEKAGLKTGFIIEKVNDVSLKELLEKIRLSGASQRAVLKQLPIEVVTYFINGEKETSVELLYLDEKNQSRQIEIKRQRLEGETVKLIPNLPKQFLKFEAESINDEIGLIKFNIFAVSIIEKFCSALTALKDKKAIIIDLRGNLGGSMGALWVVSGMLAQELFSLGTEINRTGKEPRFIRPQAKNFKGKIVILIDELSFSAAEIFAAAMQENKRAAVIGDKSAGEALPAVTMVLPTGAVFLYPISNFETPKGNLIEGRGVTPDILVPLDRSSLLTGKDRQLESAVTYLKNEISKPLAKTGKVLGSNGSGKPPPPPPTAASNAMPQPQPKQDARAVKIFEDFVKTIGGSEALKKISSYQARGKAVLKRSGTVLDGEITILRKAPNKAAEVFNFTGIGEIIEVFDGKEFFVQSPITGVDRGNFPSLVEEKGNLSDFEEFFKVKEIYPTLTFLGEFERDGKKVNLVEAASELGLKTVFAFDSASNLLVHRAGTYTDIAYGDYRKVGEILFPFEQSRSGVFSLYLDEVRLNEKIDENIFVARESCFEKPVSAP